MTVDCRYFKGMIDPYLDGELGEEDIKLFEGHIRNCHDCKIELEETRVIISLLGKLDEEPLPQDFRENLFTKLLKNQRHRGREWLKWAGAIAGAIILMFSIKAVKDMSPMGGTLSNKGVKYENRADMGQGIQDEDQADTAAAPKDTADEMESGQVSETAQNHSEAEISKEADGDHRRIESDTLEVYVEDVCITPQTLKLMAINNELELAEIDEDSVVIVVKDDEQINILYKELSKMGEVKEVGGGLEDGKVRIIIKSRE